MNKPYCLLLPALAVLLHTGCSHDLVTDKANLTTLAAWHHQPDTQPLNDTADLKKWWGGFQDSLLNELISQALSSNQDLKIANARIQEALALVVIGESSLYPSIDLNATGGQEKSLNRIFAAPGPQGMALIMPTGNAVSGGLNARWEIDLFGGRHFEADAANAQFAGIEAEQHAIQVALLAQIAGNYLELRGVQARMELVRQQIALQQKRQIALQLYFQQGLVNATAVSRQHTQLRSNESALPVLNQAAEQLIHRLSVLLGQTPASLENRLSAAGMPPALPVLPNVLPTNLLSQRPDLKIAEAQVNAAADQLGTAKANLYPRLVLQANAGFGAIAVGGFPNLADSVYSLGSGLTGPIFNAGRIRAQITAADARLEQAATTYEKTFLLAMEDVENAYVSHDTAKQRLQQLSEAEQSADTAYRHAELLYQHGGSDYLSQLDAEFNKLNIQEEKTKAQTSLRVSYVSLYRAFGGGWEATEKD